jgi:hypothetical protein
MKEYSCAVNNLLLLIDGTNMYRLLNLENAPLIVSVRLR